MRQLLAIVLLLCGASPAIAQAHDQGTSEESAYFVYREKAEDVTFLVDAFSAYFAEGQPYVPLHVGVARFKGSTLELTLESFRLVDSEGNSVYPAPFADLSHDYERLQQDKQLMIERPMSVGDEFSILSPISATFYPVTQSPRMATERVELPNGTWWQDSIYFPMPPAGLGGVMSMDLRLKGLDAPITVRFEVPLKHKHKPERGPEPAKSGDGR